MEKIEGKILIVDDDTGILQTAKVVLRQNFTTVQMEQNPAQIPYLMNTHHFDVVLLDMNFSPGIPEGKEGLQWLEKIKALDQNCQVIMVTAYGEINLAVKAMKYGATDFVIKPWENEKLLATVIAAFKYRKSAQEVLDLKSRQREFLHLLGQQEEMIWGESEGMASIFKTIQKVSATEASVLILGENGTGKEVLAKTIHQLSPRHEQPFIKVDLGAISSGLFESELFGHKKGAFTDAHQDRTGRIELASGGTLFLDEIGNITPEFQIKLLSVLQNRVIIPVGSSMEIPINVRVISASNADINTMIQSGLFREDLLYRLKTVEITLPPLRERKEDIQAFADHFIKVYSAKYRKPTMSLAGDTIQYLQAHSWAGNIRELQHAIERAVIMSDSAVLKKKDFDLQITKVKSDSADSLKLDDVERQTIIDAINKFGGNLSKASLELGLGRTTLYRKIQKYGL